MGAWGTVKMICEELASRAPQHIYQELFCQSTANVGDRYTTFVGLATYWSDLAAAAGRCR